MKWIWLHLDQIILADTLVWLLVGVSLVVCLDVFHRRPLATAPARPSGLSLQVLAGVILLYIGAAVLTEIAVAPLLHLPPRNPATLPAAPVPTSLPHPGAVINAPPLAVATVPSTAPGTLPAAPATSTAPASQPASRPATRPAPHAALFNELLEQIANTAAELIAVLFIIYLAATLTPGGLDAWGFSLRKIPKGIEFGLLAFIIIYPILEFVAILINFFIQTVQHRQEEVHETLKAISQPLPPWQQILFIVLAGIAAPVLEELFFRGLLQTTLTQRRFGFTLGSQADPLYRPTVTRRWIAILITSFLFAAAHFLPDHFPVLFLLSIALGYVYERTGNLWSNITLHAAFNLINMYFVLSSR